MVMGVAISASSTTGVLHSTFAPSGALVWWVTKGSSPCATAYGVHRRNHVYSRNHVYR